jgi:two-component system, NtrC family, sensor kinase
VNSADAGINLGHAVLRDVFDKPILLLRAQLPRQVSAQGKRAASLGSFTTIGGAIGILAILGGLLGQVVLRPLGRVTRHALGVGQKDDLSARLDFRRADEIGTLAGEFDRMVERLANTRQELLAVARRAGMAEVATDVLHNVGNVLNSVNVSVNLLADKLRDSGLDTLRQLTALVRQHEGDLPAFIADDERGRRLPQFLGQLTDVLSDEHARMLKEIESLLSSVDHIKHVVQNQQASACNERLIELVQPADLVEEAIRLNGESFERHDIEVVREFSPTPPALLDRHKVLAILVNLISNARQAIKAMPNEGRRVTFGIDRTDAGVGQRLVIRVADTGVGIPAENLDRIFSFGFSTQAGGRGFGLHAVANAAAELGGSVVAASDGTGRGARFTLTLPVSFKESPCCSTASRQPVACL